MEEASVSIVGERSDEPMIQFPKEGKGEGRLCEGEKFNGCRTNENELAEDNDESMTRSVKRARIGEKSDEKVDGNLKRVAEIVIVLAAMGRMRGGRSATDVERELMAEARKKLTLMWETLPPKALLSNDKRDSLVEDLGFNRSNEQTGFAASLRPSIAEKLRLTMKKIQESRELVAKTTYSSHIPDLGPLPNSQGSNRTDCHVNVSSDKLNSMPQSLASFRPFKTVDQASGLASALIRRHLRPNEATGISLEILSYNSLDIEPPHSTFSAMASKHVKLESGSCATTNDQMCGSLADSSTRIHPASQEAICEEVKMPILDSAVEQAPHKFSSLSTSQPDIKGSTQIVSRSPEMHQIVQAVNSSEILTTDSIHNDISREILKILQPGLHSHSQLSPPSIAYMNASLNCEVCKAIIADIANLLVCDACEKGVHVKCLHVYNQKGVPQGEWHCPKCLMLNNGKPLAVKYGRIARTTVSRLSSTSKLHASLEIKMETVEGKLNQSKLENSGVANRHSHITKGNAQNKVTRSQVFSLEKSTTESINSIETKHRERHPTNANLAKEKMGTVISFSTSEAEKSPVIDNILPQAKAGCSTITDQSLLLKKTSSEDLCSPQQSGTSSVDNFEPSKQVQLEEICHTRVCAESTVSPTENGTSSVQISDGSSAVNLQGGQNGSCQTGGNVDNQIES